MIGGALQSVCKTYPIVAEEHLLSPLLLELKSSGGQPACACLLAQLSPSPLFLESSILPALIALLCSLLTHPADHNCVDSCVQDWKPFLSISATLVKIVEHNAKSTPLTSTLLKSVVALSQQVTKSHWVCCSEQVNAFVEVISSAISFNTQHASEKWVSCGSYCDMVASSFSFQLV